MRIMISACLLGKNCKYNGGKKIDGQGIFARLLTENGFRIMDVEDLDD